MRVSTTTRPWSGGERPSYSRATMAGVANHNAMVAVTMTPPTTVNSAENDRQASDSSPSVSAARVRCLWKSGMKTMLSRPDASR